MTVLKYHSRHKWKPSKDGKWIVTVIKDRLNLLGSSLSIWVSPVINATLIRFPLNVISVSLLNRRRKERNYKGSITFSHWICCKNISYHIALIKLKFEVQDRIFIVMANYLQCFLNHTPILSKLSKSDCGLQKRNIIINQLSESDWKFKGTKKWGNNSYIPFNAMYIIRKHNHFHLNSFLLQRARILHAFQEI